MHLRTLGLTVTLILASGCPDDKGSTESTGTLTDGPATSTTTETSTTTTEASTSETGDTQPTVGTTTTTTGITTDGSDTAEPTVGTDTAPSTTSDEEELDPRCMCLNGCGEKLCPDVGLHCEAECTDEDQVNDEAALQCALEALRDRKKGHVGWYVNEYIGQFGYKTRAIIREDGDANVRRSSASDLCSAEGPNSVNSLEDPAYFEDCLALPTSRERFSCLTGALLDEIVACEPAVDSCEF